MKRTSKYLGGNIQTTDDPFVVLQNAGIDIEPELEEFRQFLAEISGKKIEKRSKFSEVTTADVRLKAQKLLGMLNGLKFAGYSENALKELDARIDKLINEKNLELLGLYLGFQRLFKRRDFKRAERFLKL